MLMVEHNIILEGKLVRRPVVPFVRLNLMPLMFFGKNLTLF